jgi:hypothetical protein
VYISKCMRFVAVIVVNVVSGVQGAIHSTLVGRYQHSGGQGRTGASKLWFSGQ